MEEYVIFNQNMPVYDSPRSVSEAYTGFFVKSHILAFGDNLVHTYGLGFFRCFPDLEDTYGYLL